MPGKRRRKPPVKRIGPRRKLSGWRALAALRNRRHRILAEATCPTHQCHFPAVVGVPDRRSWIVGRHAGIDGRLPTSRLMTRKRAMIAAWFVVLPYRFYIRKSQLRMSVCIIGAARWRAARPNANPIKPWVDVAALPNASTDLLGVSLRHAMLAPRILWPTKRVATVRPYWSREIGKAAHRSTRDKGIQVQSTRNRSCRRVQHPSTGRRRATGVGGR